MTIPIMEPIDMSQQEIRNAVAQNLGVEPSSPVEGLYFYHSGTKLWGYWNGTAWVYPSAATGAILSSLVDAKGDIPVATGDNTVVRKAVGADGTILIAKSANGDGLEWRVLADGDIPAAIMRDAEHTLASHQELIATADLTDWPRVAALDFNGQKITGLADPTGDQDAANKRYVDAAAAGIDWKRSVRVATTAAGTLASSFENGDTIDGVVLATGNEILIKDQASGAENGLYTVNASGAPTRRADADTAAELTAGFAVFVEEGTVNHDSGWNLTNDGAIVVGTTALVFGRFTGLSDVIAGAGLTKTGAQLDAGAGAGIIVNANDIAIDPAVVARKFAANLSGSSTSYTVTHNLGTLDVIVRVVRVFDGVVVMTDVTVVDTNNVAIGFAVAPSTNAFRAVVLG